MIVPRAGLDKSEFPCDLDTTSLAWTILKDRGDNAAHEVMNEMLRYQNSDGIIQVSKL